MDTLEIRVKLLDFKDKRTPESGMERHKLEREYTRVFGLLAAAHNGNGAPYEEQRKMHQEKADAAFRAIYKGWCENSEYKHA